MNELINNNLVEQIKSLLEASRQKIAVEVNTTLLHTYWQIGKIIVEDEALHIGDIEYEKQSLRQLSKVLTTEFGKGFSRSNLSNMRPECGRTKTFLTLNNVCISLISPLFSPCFSFLFTTFVPKCFTKVIILERNGE